MADDLKSMTDDELDALAHSRLRFFTQMALVGSSITREQVDRAKLARNWLSYREEQRARAAAIRALEGETDK